MKTAPLPDPLWDESPSVCVGCGYALAGLARPGHCPECAMPFGTRHLIVAGVVKRSRRTPLGRRLGWAGVFGAFIAVFILWPIIAMFSAVALLVAIVAAVAGLMFLLATSKRERRAVERFCFSPAGITRLALKPAAGAAAGHDAVLTHWAGANCVEFKRISPFWRRVRIGIAEPSGHVRRPTFEAGVRCPDSMAAEVETVVREFVTLALRQQAAATAPRA